MSMAEYLDDVISLDDVPQRDRASRWDGILKACDDRYGASQPECVHLVRGVAGYHFPELTDDGQECERDLMLAALRPSLAITARFYLGCHCFDHRRFKDALEHWNSIDTGVFVENGQSWRALKVEELRLCCEIESGRFAGVLEKFSRWRDAVFDTPEDGVPAPLEMLCSLEANLNAMQRELGTKAHRECVMWLWDVACRSQTEMLFRERIENLRATVWLPPAVKSPSE